MDIKLGRLRQWAGEVISSREKTSVNEEFAALEKDIELRKEGINKMITASESYHRALSKKEASEALKEDEKLLPLDSLGIVMIQHGGQFGEDSTFGNALVKLGGAQCKIATLQEAYALTFKDTFLASMEKCRDEIKEYESLRKKLDSRKCAADSAIAKFEKLQSGKKEKDIAEAQDEMERMKQRYEETVEDLRAYMHAIQENELNQLQGLTALIDTELNFVQNYLSVLKEVKSDFHDNISTRQAYPKNRNQILRSVQIPRNVSADSVKLPDDGYFGSNPNSEALHARSNSNGSSKSNKSTRSGVSRKRTDSATTSIGTGDDKDKSRRMSVAEWASSAMESVTGGGKNKKNKSDKDSFSTLDDSPTENQSGESGVSGKPSSFLSITRLASKATGSLSGGSPRESSPGVGSSSSLATRGSGKILKPQSIQRRKTVRALHDFTGSSDELSFKAGMEIVVLHEVLDDWWMGEVDGQTGLFPTSYTEVGGAKFSPGASRPPSLSRSWPETESRMSSLSGRRSNDLTPKHRPVDLPAEEHSDTAAGHVSDHASDVDDDDTRELSRLQPMMVNVKSPVYYSVFDNDSESFTTDGSEILETTREETTTVFPSAEVTVHTESGDDWVTFNEGHAGRGETAQKVLQRDQKRRQTPPPQPSSKQRTLSLLGSFGSSLKVPILDPAQQPLISRAKSEDPTIPLFIDTENIVNGSQNQSSPMKRAPPPPPPRKQGQKSSALPPIPVRKVLSVAQSNPVELNSSSTGSLPLGQSPNFIPRNSFEIVRDRSPFDSAVELGLNETGNSNSSEGQSRDRFRQNPFKPGGDV